MAFLQHREIRVCVLCTMQYYTRRCAGFHIFNSSKGPVHGSGLDLPRTLLTPSKCSVKHWFVHLLRYRVMQKKLIKRVLPLFFMLTLVFWGSGSGVLEQMKSNAACVSCCTVVLTVCMCESYSSRVSRRAQHRSSIAIASQHHHWHNERTIAAAAASAAVVEAAAAATAESAAIAAQHDQEQLCV